MAVDLCSEVSGGGAVFSPRISFSRDFCQTDGATAEQHSLLSDSSTAESCFDFDFCVRESFDRDSSSADELFAGGKILPIQIKKKEAPPKPPTDQSSPPRLHPSDGRQNPRSVSSKGIKNAINDPYEKQNSRSFWRFNRSSSLNCGSGYGRSLCPLPLLSRSNSTGSSPVVKRSQMHKEGYGRNERQYTAKQSSSAVPPATTPRRSQHLPRPPPKKSYGGNSSQNRNAGGVRVSPVLNVAPSTIFRFGSFFVARDKSKKRQGIP